MRIQRRLVAVAVGALVVAGGCNCSPTHVQKVDPALGPVPDGIDFGLVAVGDSGTQVLTLIAESSADLSLDAHIEDPSGPFRVSPAPPSIIPGDGDVVLTLLYSPTKVGTDAGTLVINTDDPDHARGDRRVLLSGQGKSPEIQVTPDRITMAATACPTGASSATCSASTSFSIKNVGQVPLKLGTVDLEPQDPSKPIPPVSQLGIAPLISTSTMTAGQTVTSQVVWKPLPSLLTGSAAETFDANLVVPSNDPAHPTVKVPVEVTANPNLPPKVCLSVAKVTQTVYLYQNGEATPQQQTLPAQDYDCAQNPALDCPAGVSAAVRPGAVVTLTSEGTDPATGKPCTFDPEGGVLSYAWSTDFTPDPSATQATSRAEVTPGTPPSTGALQLDAVGSYTVHLVVKDNLGQPASASVTVDGVPHDDLAVQLSWQGQQYQGADLDLHLLTDQGPNLSGPAVLFCEQDTFWGNPAWPVFGNWDGGAFEAIPHLLRDDQGTAGQLESTSLISAPPDSKFRVAVDLWNPGPLGESGAITPTLDVWLKNDAVHQTLSPTTALQGTGDVWVAAEVDFPTDPTALPTVTKVDSHLKPVKDAPTQTDSTGQPLAGYYWNFDHTNNTVGACQ